ncbi:MAG: hypothetical protein LBT79_05085 [Elusimicrobiota bacterium]|jgi:DNA-binding phage protein|nr:hypothetical protein [Elusimicrobiota bacterium]
MKKTKTNLDDFIITPADVRSTGETISDYYANYLKAHPKELEDYKKHVIEEYNKTKDNAMFLKRLKTIAKAQSKVPKIRKKAKIKRENHRDLSKDDNRQFSNLIAAANSVGIDFIACSMR